MKKILVAAAFVTFCSLSTAIAQTAVQTEKAAVATDVQQPEVKKEKKAASCCSSKKSADAKACADKGEKTAAGKSSCCQKGHNEAKVEEKDTQKNAQ